MKRSFALFIAGLICQFLNCQITDTAVQDLPAEVYFLRLPSYVGSAAKMTIMSNNQPIVRLKNASFFRYSVPQGNYVFSFALGSGSQVNLNVEAGKEYFIKCYYNTGLWSGIPIFEPVDPASGRLLLEGNKLTELSAEPVTLNPGNSRLGLTMSGGIGFERYPWFIDENGDEVTLSTGGGFGIGLEIGRRFGKNFDLSSSVSFLSASLSEPLRNASASFKRAGFTITPALVIPLRNNMFMFRIGAGPGIFTFGTMKVDGSEIDNTIYTLKYKSAFGFHALVLFESKIMERGSMDFGIRYSSIKYSFNPDGSSHLVIDPKLSEPDGSSIDFILGYNFHF